MLRGWFVGWTMTLANTVYDLEDLVSRSHFAVLFQLV
jgi:hypothetical protein